MVAPFERGLGHGGSQRASAIAERLEERGAEVQWLTVAPRDTSRSRKLRDALALRPALVGLHSAPESSAAGPADAAISAHSYLAPQLRALPDGVARVVDFHNLEWRHLEDLALHAPPARRPYVRLQVALMRRFERRQIWAADLSTFASEEELRWARGTSPAAALCLLPSVLPRRVEQEALALRPAGPAGEGLVYIGTLRFPPNLDALLAFLGDVWPRLQDAFPNLRLTVAGDCAGEDRRAIERFPGVEAVGFVPDSRRVLEPAAAAIMPIEGRAGTSLRALYCALAGIWVVGSPAAFRGLPWPMGAAVRSPAEWVAAVGEALGPPGGREQRIAAAREGALGLQRDPAPWDGLYARLAGLRSRS